MDQPNANSAMNVVVTLICLFLQVALAPHIAIAGTTPLFLAIPLLLVSASSGTMTGTLFGFILGLLYDLGSGEPVGAMALAFSVAGFTFGLIGTASGAGGPSLLALLVCIVLIEFIQGVLICVTGYEASFAVVFVRRILLGIVYTGAITAAGMAIVGAIGRGRKKTMGPATHLH